MAVWVSSDEDGWQGVRQEANTSQRGKPAALWSVQTAWFPSACTWRSAQVDCGAAGQLHSGHHKGFSQLACRLGQLVWHPLAALKRVLIQLRRRLQAVQVVIPGRLPGLPLLFAPLLLALCRWLLRPLLPLVLLSLLLARCRLNRLLLLRPNHMQHPGGVDRLHVQAAIQLVDQACLYRAREALQAQRRAVSGGSRQQPRHKLRFGVRNTGGRAQPVHAHLGLGGAAGHGRLQLCITAGQCSSKAARPPGDRKCCVRHAMRALPLLTTLQAAGPLFSQALSSSGLRQQPLKCSRQGPLRLSCGPTSMACTVGPTEAMHQQCGKGRVGSGRGRRRRQGLAACLLFSPRHHIRMRILSVYRVTEACRVEVVLRTRLCVSPEPVRDALRRHLQDNLRHVSTALRRSQAPMHATCSVAAAAAAAVPARWLSLPSLLLDASVTTEMSTGSEYSKQFNE